MNNPKISIITVVYNGVQHIEQTIQSVISQDYNNIEYIIIDGGSRDGTQEVIKKYEKDVAYWISEKDAGIYHAMNKGWKKASGEWIGILNADDYYLEGIISKVVAAFTASKAAIVYGKMTKLRAIGGESYFKEVAPNLAIMEQTMGIFHPSTFVSRKVYEDLNGFNEKYRLSADYDFLLRAYQKKYAFHYLDEVLTVFRIGGVSNTNCQSFKEGYQLLLENNSPYASQMKRAIYRCYFKKAYKQIINTLVNVFGLQKMLEERIKKKWR
ncbi:MAG: glycosyltransferase [Vicingus serpentipes]|nr:glycosyltransferase [Vicingus serpentipes]